MPHLKALEDANLVIELDPSFTGVLRGMAHDESEGCSVNGKCILNVNKAIKVRRFLVWLEGRCKVTLKSNTYANIDGSESRTLYTKDIHFLGEDGQTNILSPGQYVYPFTFDLSPNLPASFRGKRGYIRYRLQAAVYRPMFASDIVVSRDIPIRRCLLNDQRMANLRETYAGIHHTNKIHYTANAPTISYREGGLIRLNLVMQLLKPETQIIRTVTCALRERIQYRTTDSYGQTALSKTDYLFPLGFTTFYPSKAQDYNPKEKSEYNTLFRLCPRVNADLNSRLMKINHALEIRILVQDTNPEEEETNESCYETDVTESEWASEDDHQHRDIKQKSLREDIPVAAQTPPEDVSPISRSSSASSLVSLLSLGRHNKDDSMVSLPSLKTTKRKQKRRHHGPSLAVCSIEIPLVVTSREDTWNTKNTPPSYVDEPPSYHSTVNTLPRAPTYDNDTAISTPSVY